jgi:hypothetical protein
VLALVGPVERAPGIVALLDLTATVVVVDEIRTRPGFRQPGDGAAAGEIAADAYVAVIEVEDLGCARDGNEHEEEAEGQGFHDVLSIGVSRADEKGV